MPPRFGLPAIAAAFLLSGCAYTGSDMGNPLTRKLQWYSFVEGGDIAAACAPGGSERFRLVYNAIWEQQVRTYEWDSSARTLAVSVIRQGNVASMDLTDPLSPWRADTVSVPLDQSAYDGLGADLEQSGAFGTPAVGLELPSHSYYWTVAACRQGSYSFTAWAYPSKAYDGVRFPAALAALDPGRDGIVQPALIPLDPIREYDRRRGAAREFTLKVGARGLQ
jgi:hypothetical protein